MEQTKSEAVDKPRYSKKKVFRYGPKVSIFGTESLGILERRFGFLWVTVRKFSTYEEMYKAVEILRQAGFVGEHRSKKAREELAAFEKAFPSSITIPFFSGELTINTKSHEHH